MSDSSQSFSFEKLWSELLRRRVVRVAVVYAVVGWVVIEVASTVLPPLGLPNWAVKLVIVLVALGFPIAVAMAWMFDSGHAIVAPSPGGPAPQPIAATAGVPTTLPPTARTTAPSDGRARVSNANTDPPAATAAMNRTVARSPCFLLST